MQLEFLPEMSTTNGDLSIVNAARVSFGKWKDAVDEKDEKLIRYLATHKHMSPFRHNSLSFRVKIPLWLRAQWVKHQVGGEIQFKDDPSNEVSRRYVDDEPEFHIPNWRKRPEGGIKQGSGEEFFPDHKDGLNVYVYNIMQNAKAAYNFLLREGVAPEQARTVLPVATYTTFIQTGSLEFWAHMYKLRSDSHAQSDWHPLMAQLDAKMQELFPIAWPALVEAHSGS